MNLIKIIKYYSIGSLLYIFGLFLYGIHPIFLVIVFFYILFRFFKKKKKVTKVFKEIDQMTGYEFEEYLEEIFESLGYQVQKTKKSQDQGGDLIIIRKGIKTAVQAKRYSQPVGNKAVQEVISAREYYNCDKGLVVTNSSFTKSAKELAKKCNVKLWNEEILKEIIT